MFLFWLKIWRAFITWNIMKHEGKSWNIILWLLHLLLLCEGDSTSCYSSGHCRSSSTCSGRWPEWGCNHWRAKVGVCPDRWWIRWWWFFFKHQPSRNKHSQHELRYNSKPHTCSTTLNYLGCLCRPPALVRASTGSPIRATRRAWSMEPEVVERAETREPGS